MIDKVHNYKNPSLGWYRLGHGVECSGVKDCIEVPLGDDAYSIVSVDRDFYLDLRSYSKVLLVLSKNVAKYYLEFIKPRLLTLNLYVHILEDGEERKNWESVASLLETAFLNQLDRKSLMVAFGGGVVSDLVGFASGIYQRGVDFLNLPTTLLSQVDASVGGKCGINNAHGKNLIGLFHQPCCIVICIDFLRTLPKREFYSGLAEILKIAICFDGDFFCELEAGSEDLWVDSKKLPSFILRAISLKARVVQDDERERGIRAALNYGHTFGHAIELLGDYKDYLHGEAVAIGMQMANLLSLKLGKITESEKMRIERVLQAFHLKLEYKIHNVETFYKALFTDKKTEFGKLRFVIPRGIGNFEICDGISKDVVLEVLEAFRG